MNRISVPYLAECIFMDSESAKKYIEIVSSPDTEAEKADIHHIVPVSYFRQEIGIDNARSAYSPDMAPENLVRLTHERHLLAHYYLHLCIRPKYRNAMALAFAMMSRNFDYDGCTNTDIVAIRDVMVEAAGKVRQKSDIVGGMRWKRTRTEIRVFSYDRKDRKSPIREGMEVGYRHDGRPNDVKVSGGLNSHYLVIMSAGPTHIAADIHYGDSRDAAMDIKVKYYTDLGLTVDYRESRYSGSEWTYPRQYAYKYNLAANPDENGDILLDRMDLDGFRYTEMANGETVIRNELSTVDNMTARIPIEACAVISRMREWLSLYGTTYVPDDIVGLCRMCMERSADFCWMVGKVRVPLSPGDLPEVPPALLMGSLEVETEHGKPADDCDKEHSEGEEAESCGYPF